jgi:hypothetical protein
MATDTPPKKVKTRMDISAGATARHEVDEKGSGSRLVEGGRRGVGGDISILDSEWPRAR